MTICLISTVRDQNDEIAPQRGVVRDGHREFAIETGEQLLVGAELLELVNARSDLMGANIGGGWVE